MTSLHTPRRAARLLSTSVILAIAACSKGDGGTAPPKPASVSNSTVTTPTATVGTALTTAPTFTVKDASGNAMGNVAVTVVVSSGGGSLVGAPTRTSAGATSVGTWTLGTTAGVNALTVTISGLTPLIITATGTAGAPTKLVASGGNAQTALAGAAVALPLGATLQDQFGNGVPNVPVSFQVTAGGGVVGPGLLTTNANGVATGASWLLGNKGGTQTASATAAGFTAQFTANIQSTYPLDLRFYGPPMSAEAQTAFVNAANRMRAAIISPTTTFPVEGRSLANDCGLPDLTGTLTGTTAGVIIYAAVTNIDGPGKILAQAGPCNFVRGSNKLPFLGVMEFDSSDIQNYITTGRFEAVVLHEMNHVLGLGTVWDLKGLLANPAFDTTGAATGSTNPRFLGSAAVANCLALGGQATHCAAATGVAVEATGGSGTADGHWRESLFNSELMTGFVESTPTMPWSTMSIGSFQDLGYTVNTLAADGYGVPSLLTMARLSRMDAASTQDGPYEVLRRPKFEISASGRVTPIREKK
ncbi:MAG: leishmanolysin-related zinc metalloendopeptidase [Gemmatimonadaceae bacterium]